jgi:hypothetical protein
VLLLASIMAEVTREHSPIEAASVGDQEEDEFAIEQYDAASTTSTSVASSAFSRQGLGRRS